MLFTAAAGAVEPVLASCFRGVLDLAGFASDDTARSCDAACCLVVRVDILRRVRQRTVQRRSTRSVLTLARFVWLQEVSLM